MELIEPTSNISLHQTNKNSTANHRNSKKTTTFVFNKRSVTYLRKCPIIQHLVSDSGHSIKELKRSGTTRICKAMKYNGLHLSLHSVYLSKQRLYRLKWMVTDNQWCKYAASIIGNEKATVYFQLLALKYCISNNLSQNTKNFGDRQIRQRIEKSMFFIRHLL